MKRRQSLLLAVFLASAVTGGFLLVSTRVQERANNRLKSSDTLKVAALLPLTGTSSDIGKWQQRGIEIAKKQWNSDTTKPSKISIIYEDTASDVKTSISSFEKVSATSGAQAYLLSLSSVANALAPRFTKKEEPALLLAVSLPKITERSENYYRFNLGSEQEAERMAEYIKKTDLRRIAVLSINDEFGQGAQESFVRNMQGTATEIVYEDAYEKNQTDFRSIILRLSTSRPDAVYVIGYVKSSILLIKQMRELGIQSRILANMALSVPAFQKLGGTALDGATYTVTDFRVDSTAPQTQSFVKAYQESYGEPPPFFAAFAHDSLITLAKASASKNPIKTSLNQLAPFFGATGEIEFNPKRILILKVRVVRNLSGSLIEVD
jgi:branched-chain amino acid transport system substrate-binding protein